VDFVKQLLEADLIGCIIVGLLVSAYILVVLSYV
jgi:hypothetical protein